VYLAITVALYRLLSTRLKPTPLVIKSLISSSNESANNVEISSGVKDWETDDEGKLDEGLDAVLMFFINS
jgi:hypothetical protein